MCKATSQPQKHESLANGETLEATGLSEAERHGSLLCEPEATACKTEISFRETIAEKSGIEAAGGKDGERDCVGSNACKLRGSG